VTLRIFEVYQEGLELCGMQIVKVCSENICIFGWKHKYHKKVPENLIKLEITEEKIRHIQDKINIWEQQKEVGNLFKISLNALLPKHAAAFK
jgi:tRNA A37 threonylcarbamoyladenosine biosynthesis protein TsaE